MGLEQPDAQQRREQTLVEFAARGVHLRRRSRLDAVSAEAIDALRDVGIDALLLKGAALAQALYGPDLERGYFDIDLIVSPSAKDSAGQVISELGFTNVSAAHGIEEVADVLHAEVWSRLDEEIGNVTIDLHWKLEGCLAAPEIVWNTLRSSAEPMTVAGSVVFRLERPGLALHTALHLAQHGLDDPKAAADLSLAVTRWNREVWDEAAQLARDLSAVDAFASGLRLLPAGERLADILGVAPTEESAWDMAHRNHKPRGTHHLQAFGEAHNLTTRLTLLRRALLPSPKWISWEIRWARRSPGHLATAYFLHLLRAPLWAWRAYRFTRARARERRSY